ncbi:MAG: amidohydrolase family protein [Gemmatimonadaceae bacterium]|nr:amidohydrolase family protein [Gemmatimonadaceae bacterium]
MESGPASRSTRDGATSVAFTNATLIDGTGAAPRTGITVLVAEGRVAGIFPTGSRSLPANARVVNVAGKFLLPGFIDAHVHITYPFITRPRQDSILTFLFHGGVTAVRDLAGDAVALSALKNTARAPSVGWPQVYYSAVMAGAEFMRTDRRLTPVAHGLTSGEAPWLRAIKDSTDILLAIQVARWTGATGIKLYAELPASLVVKLSEEAHRQGLKVWSHSAIVPARPSDAVASGVDVLSHGDVLVLEGNDTMPATLAGYNSARRYAAVPVESQAITTLLEHMVRRGTMLEPTLYQNSRYGAFVQKDTARRALWPLAEWSYALTRRAQGLGVRVVAGTDLMGWPATDSLPYIHDEMELLVTKAGFTPLQALTSATLNGARSIGIEHDYGTASVGKIASFVILRSDPTVDIRNTRTVDLIVKEGVIHQRAWPAALSSQSLERAPLDSTRIIARSGVQPAGTTAAPQSEIWKEVVARNRAMEQAAGSGSMLGVARTYSDDSRIIGAGGRAIASGRTAIDAYWSAIRDAKTWQLDVIEVGGSRDMPYQLGRSTLVLRSERGERSVVTNFLIIWKRNASGTLEVYLHHYN